MNAKGDIDVAQSDLAALAVKKDIPTNYLVGGEQTTTSSADGGSNVFTFTKADGATVTFTVKNGSKGSNGPQGEQGPVGPAGPKGETGEMGPAGAAGAKGDIGPQGPRGATGATGAAAGFGTPTATIDNATGVPSVTVTASGEDTAKVFAFAFKNLKGEKGDQGPAGAAGAKGDTGEKGEPGAAGAKGDAGASVTAINLVKDASGAITGGTATLSDGTSITITVTTAEA